VSKNVAVFVDVANIFYAAKAAGVDIDYVTLLKAATAGRDFVRAYAYTGLDPENENQRQFHSFLARNNYKVISKDIRKYGDGRIKANLDIELVVDMMKTARNLDIAVVVSGDGDFASAIRAVQEMGVRVEVISFRGNTSSDLIEAADLFIDIAQIARVDKSGRSGRRVAAEGDLSMTEVPEKETEGVPRRRRARTTRDERPLVAEPEDKGGANIVVLPGERLSRAPDGDGEEDLEQADEADYAAAPDGNGDLSEDARRRRRRRGGRGRGRGRRPEDEGMVTVGEPSAFSSDEDEEFEELPPAQPPVHAFGSVWDSQLGVPTASMPPSVNLGGIDTDEDEDYDEPEVPEYLLAERRQRGGQPPAGRGRVPGGRNRSAYQAALDRERYGRSAPQPSFGGGAGGGNNANRAPDRNRDRGRQGRPQQARRPVDRAPRVRDRQMSESRPASAEPWSEVPPELEQMLRAELARKQGGGAVSGTELTEVEVAAVSTAPLRAMAEAADVEEANVERAAAKPTRRRTPRKTAPEPANESAAQGTTSTETSSAEAGATDAATAKPARKTATPRTTAARTTATRATPTRATSSAAKPSAAKATRSPRKTSVAADSARAGEPSDGTAGATEAAPPEPKKPARRRTTKSAASAEEG
jgi:uncharacterized LabA/DUF88 family protein